MENELKNPSSNVQLEKFDQNIQQNGKWLFYLLRNKKFAKSNSFEADFHHAEVTDM